LDTTVRLWDVMTGTLNQTLEDHIDWIKGVVFSPDGRLVASSSRDRTVRLWDAMTGAWMQTLEGHSDCVENVAFSPDCKLLASASRGWDRTTLGRHGRNLETDN